MKPFLEIFFLAPIQLSSKAVDSFEAHSDFSTIANVVARLSREEKENR